MINDPKIIKAINTISLRSERQSEDKKLIDSFVDIGILNVLVNKNHQIIFGRRGTGKTHVLKVLGNEMLVDNTKIVYIDCRMLGSASSITDDTMRPNVRCIHLFKDFLNNIHLSLLDYLFEEDTSLSDIDSEKALILLDELLDSYNEYEKKILKATERYKHLTDVKDGIGVEAEVSKGGPKIKASYKSQEERALESECYQEYSTKETLVFPNLSVNFNKLLDILKLDLVILIDEWVNIPKILQPIFSEFLKRSLLVCNRITVKIASIEYHSLFMRDIEGGQRIGIEVGSDVSDAISLDDFYVFDLNKDYVVNYFKNVLFKHLKGRASGEIFI